MIQEIIWSNLSVAGMAFLTLGTIIVAVCVGVGFMIQVRHRGKKNERTGRHVPGSSRDRGRIAPDSELGRKLVSLDFRVNPGKVYKPSGEAQKLAEKSPVREPAVVPAPVVASAAKTAEERPSLRVSAQPVVARVETAGPKGQTPEVKPALTESSTPSAPSPVKSEGSSAPPQTRSTAAPPVVPVTRPPAPEQTLPAAKPAVHAAPVPEPSQDQESVELTTEEQEAVLKIQEMLGLPTARVVLSVLQIEAILACGRALQKELKPIPVKDVILDPGEKAYFEFPADLLEIPAGGGVRLHFPPEFYLDVFRGIITSSPPAQKIESGRLIISSRRVLFVGSNRTLAMTFDLITGMDLFMDLLRINSVGRERVCALGLENPPLVALAISYSYRETSG